LQNGDSLKAKAWQVPAGRPKVWEPPNDWVSSAVDALSYEGFTSASAKRRGWSLEAMLYRFERYNGLGSRKRGINSPYLWSYSNQYAKGKYVRDGVWDGEAVSKQCGAVVLIKALIEEGAIEPPKFYEKQRE
jgi:lysozyme family protein